MTRPRPAGLADGSVRYILWVDIGAMETAAIDAMIADVLATVERYSPAAHIEVPLGLVDPA